MKQDLTRILTETMQLIDGCLPSTGELLPLREAATMIIFRLLLIHETHRQGILFRRDPEPCESLALFREITLAIREGGSDRIAIVGPSIFGNSLPTRIDPETTAYLDAFDLACSDGLPLDLRQRWDALVLRVGIFAVEVTSATGNLHHRALGDVYEQILGLTPQRDKDGSCSLDDGDSKSTRRKLGAHYTPHELVEEIVRPALGHMFEQIWNELKGETPQNRLDAYSERIQHLHVVDPAMGSAHFLTVTALEIAREAAWVQLNGTHRPFDWHEPLTHTNPIGENTKDSEERQGETYYTGEGKPQAFQTAVQSRLPNIVRQCIHGVDINPLAAELGKLALWLFTMSELDDATDEDARPTLTFLDANIRSGDSLVGLSWSEVIETFTGRLDLAGEAKKLHKQNGGQKTLFGPAKNDPSTTQRAKQKAAKDTLKTFSQRRERVALLRDASRLEDHELQKWATPQILTQYGVKAPDDPKFLSRNLLHRAQELQREMKWLYDLTLLARYHDYSTRKKKGFQAFASALGLSEAASHEEISSTITALLKKPFAKHTGKSRNFLDALEASAHKLRAFHWELEFAHVFNPRGKNKKNSREKRGFDVVVANPPFVGSSQLRQSFNLKYIDYIANQIANGQKPDLAGFFFLKYRFLVNVGGVASSLASNSICQGKNRRAVLKTLILNNDFYIIRSERSGPWPGDANVLISKILFSRNSFRNIKIIFSKIIKKISSPISSYLDAYPDVNWKGLPSMYAGVVYNGMYLKGQYFLHTDPSFPLSVSIESVPKKERDSIKAYVNSLEIQQNPRPTPSRVTIDFIDDLINEKILDQSASLQLSWLEKTDLIYCNN